MIVEPLAIKAALAGLAVAGYLLGGLGAEERRRGRLVPLLTWLLLGGAAGLAWRVALWGAP
jgi:hypothetical protein